MTPLIAERSKQLKSTVWSRVKPMRELKEQCPEILELSAKADIVACVFSELASLEDPTITTREQVQERVKSIEFLIAQMNESVQALMAD